MLYGEEDEFREKFVFGKSFRFVWPAAFNNPKAGDGRLSFKDLTITEIGQNHDVSRQAVKDAISKAEAKLQMYENKLGF